MLSYSDSCYEPGPKVLIITGIKYLRDECASKFKAEGYQTHIARNALEGQSMYSINGIKENGIVLMDSSLYGTDAAVAHILERDRDAKIIEFDSTTFDDLDSLVDNADRLVGKKAVKFDLVSKIMPKLSIVAGMKT
jgi:hypothetical protein